MTRETSIALRVGVPVVAAAVLLAAAWLAHRPHTRSAPPNTPTDDFVCIEATADPVVEKPSPSSDIYGYLGACLKAPKWQSREWGGPIKATVADIRYWVEVERDPVWLENGSWWLPLSNEGEPDAPSGMYISVPIHGGDCGGALVN